MTRLQLKCKRCGHEWLRVSLKNLDKLPKAYPRCKSPYWDSDYVRTPKKKRAPAAKKPAQPPAGQTGPSAYFGHLALAVRREPGADRLLVAAVGRAVPRRRAARR
jgi:hypothetical protein